MDALRWISVAMVLFNSTAFAGSTSRSFGVSINLYSAVSNDSGVCISEAFSAATNADVQVVCQSGQFVDISPHPGRPFLGVHGSAFRYYFRDGFPRLLNQDNPELFASGGTFTTLHISNVNAQDGPLEMLVSF